MQDRSGISEGAAAPSDINRSYKEDSNHETSVFLFNVVVPGVNMLRLKDGVYSRVPLLPGAPVEVRRKVLCEDAGAPVSQVWARALDKELYPMLITSHHIGVLEFAIPADADYYTEAEVQAIDTQRVQRA